MNKQQLAAKIWESANKMRSKIEANEYKDYILGFIFYKFLSNKEIEVLRRDGYTDEDLITVTEEDSTCVTYLQGKNGYFIAYENLFSTWLKKGQDFDVSNVSDAISAFNRLINPTHKKVFDKVFHILEIGLSKLGDTTGQRTRAITDLIQLINDIPMNGNHDYDVLGFIYEYLISMFAANAGKKAGEFYTPHEVSLLMSEIVAHHLRDKKTIKIYDPTSGSGSLLINIGRSFTKFKEDKENLVTYYAQELKESTYNLTRMNLVMRGILPGDIYTRNADTLENDWPYFDESDPHKTYNPLYVDAVVSNPPYSQPWDPTYKEADPRYKMYGLAPKSKADYAFLLHDLFHVNTGGIMTIVLPHGVLFRGGEEETIRKNLIENNNIDAVIGLPANIFFGTGIPTIIMVLKKTKVDDKVLIIDASKNFTKVGKNNKLQASDIKRIVDTIVERSESIEKFSRLVTRDEIRQNNYNLNIPRYVDSSEKTEAWDLYATIYGGIPNNEITELNSYWDTFPSLKQAIFQEQNIPYSKIISQDIHKTILDNKDYQLFNQRFTESFSTFKLNLRNLLINDVISLNVTKTQETISSDIFSRLEAFPLIDKYNGYQLLDDAWNLISTDLEIIQTEKFEATKIVDPKLVIKNKDGKEVEIQEGWIGRIIPFDLVQKKYLTKDLDKITALENKLQCIQSDYQELIDSLSEEDKEPIKADNSDSIDLKKIKGVVKNLNDRLENEKTLKDSLNRIVDLSNEEKNIDKEIKTAINRIHYQAKEVIENLTDEQVLVLLEEKWINPLYDSLHGLTAGIITELETKITKLAKKYETTYLDLEKQINEASQTVSQLIDELDGDEFDLKGLEEFKKLLLGK